VSEQSNTRQVIIDVVAHPLTESQPVSARSVGSGEAHTVSREQAEDSPKAGPECTSLGGSGSPRSNYSDPPPRTFQMDTFFFICQTNGRITGAFNATARTTLIVFLILSLAIAGLTHTNLVELLSTVVRTVAR